MEDFERIERFLRGEMSAEELELFNLELQTNKDLQETLAYQHLEEELLEIASRARIRKELEVLQVTLEKSGKRSMKRVHFGKRYRRTAIVAGILLLVLATGWSYLSWQRSPVRIARVEFRNYPPLKLFNLGVTRKGVLEEENALDSIVVFILRGKTVQLESAVSQLSRKIQNDPNNEILSYLLAAAYFKQEDILKASDLFEKVATDKETSTQLRYWAQYYHLLCIMQLGTQSEYLPLIEKIKTAGFGHPFYPRVMEIEKKLVGKIIR